MTSGHTTALTQVLSGLGGVGKTQLALEYTYRFADDYQLAWWFAAEERTTLTNSWTTLAERLFPEQSSAWDPNQKRDMIHLWLDGHTGWLLVFDNAPDAASIEADQPRTTNGQVLITSRDPNWRGIAHSLPVTVWSRSESIKFLLKRTQQQDEEAAGQVADLVDNLPLALELAGAYCEVKDQPLASYPTLYTNHRQTLWTDAPTLPAYSETITTTWSMAMQQIEQDEPAASALLTLCAFLAPDALPYKVLIDTQEGLPDALAQAVAEPIDLNRQIGILRQYSLIQTDGDTISMHRLVQAVVVDGLDEATRILWSAATVEWVNRVFPFDWNDVATWTTSRVWFPHAIAVTNRAEQYGVAKETTSLLLNTVGRTLQRQGLFATARETLERALVINRQAYGPNHPTVAATLNHLGQVIQAQGDLNRARTCFEDALDLCERNLDPEPPHSCYHA